jgi:hypothetical protein
MKLLRLVVILFFVFPINSFGSNPWRPSGAYQAGLGGASVGVSDVWSAANNQAGMAFLRHPGAGIYFTNAYFLQELSTKSVTGVFPIKKGAFGLAFNYFGYNYYNEINTGLSYAQRFGNNFAVAVQLDYLHLGQGGFDDLGDKSAVTFELSMMGRITKNFTIGAHVFNPVGIKYNNFAKIPACYRLGIGWYPIQQVLVAVETEMQTNEKVNLKGGVAYRPISFIDIKAGYASLPQLWDFGVGLYFGDFAVDLTPTWNLMLGWSTHVAISYQFKRSEK